MRGYQVSATLTNGSAVVTCAAAALLVSAYEGDALLLPNGSAWPVKSIDGNTQLTLEHPFVGATGTYTCWISRRNDKWVANAQLNLKQSQLIEALVSGYVMQSSTPVAIGTGSKTWAVEAKNALLPGARLRVASRSGLETHVMVGIVTEYTANSITLNVIRAVGSGSRSDWNFNFAGEDGIAGDVPPTRSISAAGLATGGGDLSANRTITVAEASEAQARALTDTATVLTPRRARHIVADQIAGAEALRRLAGEEGLYLDFIARSAAIRDYARTKSWAGAPEDLLTVSRASTKLCWSRNRLLASVPANTLAYDHDPVTGVPRGVLIEAAATNLCPRSQEIDDASWTKTGTAAVTANAAVAPDGTMTADRLTGNAGYANRIARSSIGITGGQTYTWSAFVRSNGSATGVRLRINSSGGTYKETISSVLPVTSVWTRVEMQFVSNADNTGVFPIFYCDDGGSVDVWGFQLELGPYATSHIPTGAGTAARSADNIELALSQIPWSELEGTMMAECSIDRVNTVNAWVAELSDSSTNERILMYMGNTNKSIALVQDGGATQVHQDSSAASPAAGALRRQALAWRENDFAHVINGGAVATDNAGTIPTVTKLSIAKTWANNSHINGHVRRVALLPRRMTNAEIQALTA